MFIDYLHRLHTLITLVQLMVYSDYLLITNIEYLPYARSRFEANLVYNPRILSFKKESRNNGRSEAQAAVFFHFFGIFNNIHFYPLGNVFLSHSNGRRKGKLY